MMVEAQIVMCLPKLLYVEKWNTAAMGGGKLQNLSGSQRIKMVTKWIEHIKNGYVAEKDV